MVVGTDAEGLVEASAIPCREGGGYDMAESGPLRFFTEGQRARDGLRGWAWRYGAAKRSRIAEVVAMEAALGRGIGRKEDLV